MQGPSAVEPEQREVTGGFPRWAPLGGVVLALMVAGCMDWDDGAPTFPTGTVEMAFTDGVDDPDISGRITGEIRVQLLAVDQDIETWTAPQDAGWVEIDHELGRGEVIYGSWPMTVRSYGGTRFTINEGVIHLDAGSTIGDTTLEEDMEVEIVGGSPTQAVGTTLAPVQENGTLRTVLYLNIRQLLDDRALDDRNVRPGLIEDRVEVRAIPM